MIGICAPRPFAGAECQIPTGISDISNWRIFQCDLTQMAAEGPFETGGTHSKKCRTCILSLAWICSGAARTTGRHYSLIFSAVAPPLKVETPTWRRILPSATFLFQLLTLVVF